MSNGLAGTAVGEGSRGSRNRASPNLPVGPLFVWNDARRPGGLVKKRAAKKVFSAAPSFFLNQILGDARPY
jgi:hypothetical protein